jgi:hypothetical protein
VRPNEDWSFMAGNESSLTRLMPSCEQRKRKEETETHNKDKLIDQ